MQSFLPAGVRYVINHAAAHKTGAENTAALSSEGGRMCGIRIFSGRAGVARRLPDILNGPAIRELMTGTTAEEIKNDVKSTLAPL